MQSKYFCEPHAIAQWFDELRAQGVRTPDAFLDPSQAGDYMEGPFGTCAVCGKLLGPEGRSDLLQGSDFAPSIDLDDELQLLTCLDEACLQSEMAHDCFHMGIDKQARREHMSRETVEKRHADCQWFERGTECDRAREAVDFLESE